MPFTPLHMGPGMAIKAALGRHFSLTAFGLAQVVIDIEPLLRILRGDPYLHGPSHSYLGALTLTLLGLPVALWLCPRLRQLGQALLRRYQLAALGEPWPMQARAIVLGLLVGNLSHVALDSLMHSDLQPFWPIAEANPWLFAVSISDLHWGCLLAGGGGLLLWSARGLIATARGPLR